MKKTIALAIICLFAFTGFSHAETARVTKNGGSNGYSYTKRVEKNNGDVYIWCQDPGYEECPYNVNVSDQPVMDAILAKISNGILTGSYLDNNINCVVSWESDNTTGLNSKITIVPPGQSIHEEYLPKP